jgi:hypothetical protein
MILGEALVVLAIAILPLALSAVLYVVTRRWVIAFVGSALALPALLLVSIVLDPPDARTEWQITLVLAIVWGTITGGVGTGVAAFIARQRG